LVVATGSCARNQVLLGTAWSSCLDDAAEKLLEWQKKAAESQHNKLQVVVLSADTSQEDFMKLAEKSVIRSFPIIQ
jgi:hypothetical protein